MITSEVGEWNCQVKLRREVNDETRLPALDQREILFGELITDPQDVEAMLRRAQLAILNPSVESDKFVDLDVDALEGAEAPLGSKKQYSFSENLVILEIKGPNVLNLTFIDLPGTIPRHHCSSVRGLIQSRISRAHPNYVSRRRGHQFPRDYQESVEQLICSFRDF